MKRANNVLELIGATPIVRLSRVVEEGGAQVWGKLEAVNPGGSVKDRIALAMVEAAEEQGLLKPGGTIIEPTSGNTGIGLSMIAAYKGYKMIVTMFDTASRERRLQMQAYGAEVVLTPAADGMRGAIDKAMELKNENPEYFLPQQFMNAAHPDVHRRTTGREILEQLDGEVDALVAGVGTGGTITGVGSVLKQALPDILLIAVEPKRSPVISGGEAGLHGIQGIGAGFVPEVFDRELIDEVVQVEDEQAFHYARRLAREEGLLLGPSSGANVAASIQVAATLVPGARLLTVFCDTGFRYFSVEGFVDATESAQE